MAQTRRDDELYSPITKECSVERATPAGSLANSVVAITSNSELLTSIPSSFNIRGSSAFCSVPSLSVSA